MKEKVSSLAKKKTETQDSLMWLGKEIENNSILNTTERKESGNMSLENYSEEQKEIITKLQAAQNSQKRVETFGKLMDDYGLDVMIGVVPALGDATSNTFSGLYLALEAAKAGLDKKSYLKIIGLQVADFAVGVIPLLGDAADYIFKANKMMGKDFSRHTEKLKEQARKAGVSEQDIAKIEQKAEKLPQIAETVVSLAQQKETLKKAA